MLGCMNYTTYTWITVEHTLRCKVYAATDTNCSATVFWTLNGRRISDLIKNKTFGVGSVEDYQTRIFLGSAENRTFSLTMKVLSLSQKGFYNCEVETAQGKIWPSSGFDELDIINPGN